MQLEEKLVGAICHGAAISFLPLFWLYFNERIYEYEDKVKLDCNFLYTMTLPIFVLAATSSLFTFVFVSMIWELKSTYGQWWGILIVLDVSI